MPVSQPGILAPMPSFSRYLEFTRRPDQDPRAVLSGLAQASLGAEVMIGFGAGLVAGLAAAVPGLRPFPALSGPGCTVPATPADIWVWVRGADRGRIVHDGRRVAALVAPAFRTARVVDGFKFDRGLDLTGYEDGTENPEGDAAHDAAILTGAGPGLNGSSFVATQQWVHDLDRFDGFARATQDHIIGRRRSDNEELADAPASAHVKRTAQESFDPEAIVLRRSLPWSDAGGSGLMFVAFGKSFDAFEAQLRRMIGAEDGIVDGLFRFSEPVSGSYFWCPPVAAGRLDITALGL